MFGIGGFELFIILIFGFLIFGPEKLPDIALTIGKGIARFREAQADMNETIGNDKLFDPNNPDEPFKDPIEALDKLAARQEEKRRAKESGGSAKAAAGSKSAGDPKAAAAKTDSAKATSTASTEKSERAAEKSDAAPAKSATGEAQTADEPPVRQESFTERKARYERERAARKAAEENAEKSVAEAGASEAVSGSTSASGEGETMLESADAADAPSSPQAVPVEGGER